MRKLLILHFVVIFFSAFSHANENLYWSNIKNGPSSVEVAKSQFGNRVLDPIEGIWFDDGLGTVSIIKDEQQNRFKMFIIDISDGSYKQFNQTWEATFYKNQIGYNFFSRIWYFPNSSSKYFKTQSGSAIISIATNDMIMDYERKSDTGRDMDHSLKKIWPMDTLAYNQNLLRYNSSNSKPTTSLFDPSLYKYRLVTDDKGVGGEKRICHTFLWQKKNYYTCLDNSTKKITGYSFEDGSKFLIRFQIYSGEGDFVHSSFQKNKNSNLLTGGWKRKNGTLRYGAWESSLNNWPASEINGNFLSDTGLNKSEIMKLVSDGRNYYLKGLDVKKNIEVLLQFHRVNINNTDYKTDKPLFKSNNKSVQKNDYEEKSYKDYWWVVVLIGIITFFVYTQTTKNISTKKKKLPTKIITKSVKATSVVHNSTNILFKFFRGEFSLPVSYWLWFVGIGVIINIILTLIETNGATEELFVISFLFFLAVYIYLYIGTWRSAENYKLQKKRQNLGYGWAIAAQGIMIVGILKFIVELVKEFS